MSEYATQLWQDCRGGLHDTEEEALLASRGREIEKRMESTYCSAALSWFLKDAENIIAMYEGICQLVDDQMKP